MGHSVGVGDSGHASREDARALGWFLVAAQFALIAAILVAPAGPGLGLGTIGSALGIAAVGVGLALAAWGAVSLGPALTPHPAPRPGAPRVRTGAFAVMSHPIYVGLSAAALGVAALRDGLVTLLLALTLCSLLWAKSGYESRLLRRAHPEG